MKPSVVLLHYFWDEAALGFCFCLLLCCAYCSCLYIYIKDNKEIKDKDSHCFTFGFLFFIMLWVVPTTTFVPKVVSLSFMFIKDKKW